MKDNGTSKVQSVRFLGDRLELLDQRALPSALVYNTYGSAAEVAQAIRSMVVRGAPAIACAAAFGVAIEALRLENDRPLQFEVGLTEAFTVLEHSRPTAVNLFWALRRMNAAWQGARASSHRAVVDQLAREAREIYSEDLQNNHQLGAHGAELLSDGMSVLTHCNAGALATSGHGTALGIVRSAIAAGKRISVLADETRPFLQGARLTAWELAADGIPVTIITDNMAGHFMMRGAVQAVIVGCDRVAANGDVVNKIGTYMVAVLAQRHQIPFYVACPVSTLDFATPSGESIPIEERDSSEVTAFGNVHWAPAGVRARHPAFDSTPAELVTALITEHGVISAPNREKLAYLRESIEARGERLPARRSGDTPQTEALERQVALG